MSRVVVLLAAVVLALASLPSASASASSSSSSAGALGHLDALLELAMYRDMDTAADAPNGALMQEVARTDTEVTFARKDDSDNSVRSVTFALGGGVAASDSAGSDSDSSLLSTSSRVGGACGKPLCQTSGPWQTKCEESVCWPLCLSTVFDVAVEGASDEDEFNDQVAEPGHQTALQGLFLGIGCSVHAGCCPVDARLARWTESKLQGAQQNALPIPFCKHMKDREAACAACSATVTVTPKGEETCEAHFKPADVEGAEESFERANMASPATVHKSYKEKVGRGRGRMGRDAALLRLDGNNARAVMCSPSLLSVCAC